MTVTLLEKEIRIQAHTEERLYEDPGEERRANEFNPLDTLILDF